MFDKIIIYSFPYSQTTCMECKHSEFVESKTYCSSNYICKINFEYNDGIKCDKKSPLNEIDEIINDNFKLMEKLVEYDKHGK